jgi:hypothetical protein
MTLPRSRPNPENNGILERSHSDLSLDLGVVFFLPITLPLFVRDAINDARRAGHLSIDQSEGNTASSENY